MFVIVGSVMAEVLSFVHTAQRIPPALICGVILRRVLVHFQDLPPTVFLL